MDAYQVLLMKLGAMLTPVPGPALVVAEAIAARHPRDLAALSLLAQHGQTVQSRMRSVIQLENVSERQLDLALWESLFEHAWQAREPEAVSER